MEKHYENIAKKRRSDDYSASKGIMREIFLKTISYDQTSLLKQISCPTLIIHGDADREMPIEYAYIFHREIPSATLQIMKGIGHFPFQDQPQQVAGYIKEFL
jgi:pimeloyl-ACP methyl ester carboxylesterase